jgi:hypothetical protein
MIVAVLTLMGAIIAAGFKLAFSIFNWNKRRYGIK